MGYLNDMAYIQQSLFACLQLNIIEEDIIHIIV